MKWLANAHEDEQGESTKNNSERQLDFFEEALAPTSKKTNEKAIIIFLIVAICGAALMVYLFRR